MCENETKSSGRHLRAAITPMRLTTSTRARPLIATDKHLYQVHTYVTKQTTTITKYSSRRLTACPAGRGTNPQKTVSCWFRLFLSPYSTWVYALCLETTTHSWRVATTTTLFAEIVHQTGRPPRPRQIPQGLGKSARRTAADWCW